MFAMQEICASNGAYRTYIRVLVEDIAKKTGAVAHTARLHREIVGDFQAKDMLELATVEEVAAEGPHGLRERLIPPDTALSALPAVTVAAAEGGRFSEGQTIATDSGVPIGLIRVYAKGAKFLGVGELSADGRVAPRRVFRSPEKNL